MPFDTKFAIEDDIFFKPICNICKNYEDDITCLAFPNGIPKDILIGEFIHDKVHPDQDNDIVFEKEE